MTSKNDLPIKNDWEQDLADGLEELGLLGPLMSAAIENVARQESPSKLWPNDPIGNLLRQSFPELSDEEDRRACTRILMFELGNQHPIGICI